MSTTIVGRVVSCAACVVVVATTGCAGGRVEAGLTVGSASGFGVTIGRTFVGAVVTRSAELQQGQGEAATVTTNIVAR